MKDADPHRPRKRFGQHFLHDPAVVARIVDSIDPRENDALVEIGPGTGVLTAALLERIDTLHAVEIDRDLAKALRQRFAAERLHLHQHDALEFDFAGLGARIGANPGTLRVVGNLPYNISTPLLFHLLDARRALKDMHFMLQQEVVTRMAAAPGSKQYGRLSVSLQLHCEVTPLFRVGAGAFRPPPRVESAVVRLVPHGDLALPESHLPAFNRLVTQAFGARRKTLRNALRGLLEPESIVAAGLDPGQRPENVPLQGFIELALRAAPTG